MKNRRQQITMMRGAQILGVAGFLIACASLVGNVLLLLAIHGKAEASPGSGITRWSQLEPDQPLAFAANLRMLGASEKEISALERPVKKDRQDSETSDPSGTVSPVESSPTWSAKMGVALNAPPQTFSEISPVSLPVVTTNAVADLAPVSENRSTNPTPIGRSDHFSSGSPTVVASPTGFLARPSAVAYLAPGVANSTGSSSSVPGPSADDGNIVAPSADSKIPVAFAPISPDLNLSEQQKSRVAQIQDQFLQDSGAGGSVPPKPESWANAVTLADQEFRAQFGDVAYLAQQRQEMQGAK